MTARKASLLVLLTLGFGACSAQDPELMNFRASRTGPDEFLVAPARPLQQPPSQAILPPPTPGAGNRADPTPEQDAVAALGGNPALVAPGRSVPGADAGLVNYTNRLGRDPAIRQTLATEDLEYRQRNTGRLLERWANVNVYYRAYEQQELDQQAEQARLRRAGVTVPPAPPPLLEDN